MTTFYHHFPQQPVTPAAPYAAQPQAEGTAYRAAGAPPYATPAYPAYGAPAYPPFAAPVFPPFMAPVVPPFMAPGYPAYVAPGAPPVQVDPEEAARSVARVLGLDPESMEILERTALSAQKEILDGLRELVDRRLSRVEASRPRARTIVVE